MVNEFLDALRDRLQFDETAVSFCTHYSWFGLVKKDRLGIEAVELFYGPNPVLLSPNLLTFRVDHPRGGSERQKSRQNHALHIEEDDGQGFSGRIVFADTGVICYHASLAPESAATGVRATLLLPATDPKFTRRAIYDTKTRILTIEARVPASDECDPDFDHPVTVCIVLPDAFAHSGIIADGEAHSATGREIVIETDGPLVLNFVAKRDDISSGEQTFLVGIGEGPASETISARLSGIQAIERRTPPSAPPKWLKTALEHFSFDHVPDRLRMLYARSAYEIISNTKSPLGRFKRPCLFPGRGGPCAQSLQDACFTNIAVTKLSESLGMDFLLLAGETQECEGWMPRLGGPTFHTREAAPPVLAWSAWTLYEKFRQNEMVSNLYSPICDAVDWWFAKRDSDGDGLAEYR